MRKLKYLKQETITSLNILFNWAFSAQTKPLEVYETTAWRWKYACVSVSPNLIKRTGEKMNAAFWDDENLALLRYNYLGR